MQKPSSLPRILAFGLVLIFSTLAQAAPAAAGFGALQGSYTGGFDGTGTLQPPMGAPTQQEYLGAISGDVRSKSLGKTGSFLFVVVVGSPIKTNALVKLTFGPHGQVKTSAIVPGMINVPATGKWKSAGGGKTVHFTLTAITADGTYTAVCILRGNTASLGLKISLTSPIVSATALNNAQFLFIGDRDKGK